MPTQNPEELPIGSIVTVPSDPTIVGDLPRILKVIKIHKEHHFKLIGNFNIDIIAKSKTNQDQKDKKFLIKLNDQLFIDDLDFTCSLPLFLKKIRPYYFQGNNDDLQSLLVGVFKDITAQKDDFLIVIENRVGKYEDENIEIWIFKGVAWLVRLGGKKYNTLIQIPDHGIMKLGEFYIYVDVSGVKSSLIPSFVPHGEYTKDEFLTLWLSQFKNVAMLYQLLGWIIATFYLEKINMLRKCSSFPFFNITASTESGKTSLLFNCIKACGFNYTGENYSKAVTLFVEVYDFSCVSNLPIWRDEYKNEGFALQKEQWAKSLFDRGSASRGTAALTVREFQQRGTLLVSGEDTSEDPAIVRRNIKCVFDKKDRIDFADWQKVKIEAAKYFSLFPSLLLSTEFNEKSFLEIFTGPNKVVDDTLQEDSLMCCAALAAIFGKDVAETAITAINATTGTYEDADQHYIPKHTSVEEFFGLVEAVFVKDGYFQKKFNEVAKSTEVFHFTNRNSVHIKHTILQKWVMSHQLAKDSYKWSGNQLTKMIMETSANNIRMGSVKFPNDRTKKWWLIVDDFKQVTGTMGSVLDRAYQAQINEGQQFNEPSTDVDVNESLWEK